MLRRVNRIRIRYRLATRLERFLVYEQKLLGALVGVIVGLAVNVVGDSSLHHPGNLLSVLGQMFSYRRVSGYVASAALLGILVAVAGRPTLERYTRRWNWLGVLSQIFSEARNPELSWLDDSTLTWDGQIMLQSAPDLRQGWKVSSVELVVEPSAYRLPSRQSAAFQKFVSTADPQRIAARAPKYGLASNPVSFTDNPRLRLNVRTTDYAKILYFKDKITPDRQRRETLIRSVLTDKSIAFPNNINLQAIIATKDGKLLLTRRSPKVEYHPNRWSCSIEEQLSQADLEPDDGGAVGRWVTRMLTEELGFRNQTLRQWYDQDARILGVLLETAVLNPGVIGLVRLGCDSLTLTKILRTHPRNDYEFGDFAFLGWDDVAQEVVRPTRDYHPTASIRMLMAGFAHFGPMAFVERLVDARVAAPTGPAEVRPGG